MPLSRASLYRLVEASPDIVVATDARGKVAYYNDGARVNLGYVRDEIIGRFVSRLYPSLEEAKRVMAAMRDPEIEGKGQVSNFATTYVAKDRREIPVAISGTILYDEEGREQGTIGFAKDLREFICKDQLGVLGEIAVGLSHEINNPLAVITNESELLGRFLDQLSPSPDGARARNRLASIRHEISRIETNLRRLTEMSEQQQYESTRYLGSAKMIDLKTHPVGRRSLLEGLRVLVVDDDAGVRDSVCDLLAVEGCDVVAAVDAEDALHRLEVSSFDLVLSDVVMPGMDGYELFMKVRERWPKTVVALMTAFYYDKDHVIKRSRLEGLEGVIFKKPIEPARLCQTIASLVEAKPDRRDSSKR